ncbi:hypothetical protein PPACK8108_LOCUS18922, partial [Phakopsora pachyrhizi]
MGCRIFGFINIFPNLYAGPSTILIKKPLVLNPRYDFLPNHTLPSYAIDYAPLVYLHSEEIFWPSLYKTHLDHVQPEVNFKISPSFPASGLSTQIFLRSSNLINNVLDNDLIYLTSKDSIFEAPMAQWIYGEGKPDESGKSAAPAIIIAMDKTQQVGSGWVDVFYIFFYSYNRGNYFYNNRFGDHVGDWENTMIRFYNGTPMYIVPEAHGDTAALGSSAFMYNAVEQVGKRPVVYSANGTHGMYPQAGIQNYTGLPVPVYDHTNKGPLWDLTLNFEAYFFSNEGGFSFTGDTPSSEQDPEKLGWLQFTGHWGDQQYPLSNPNQTCLASECFYSSGPLGPQSKSLGRGYICGSSDCKPMSLLPS